MSWVVYRTTLDSSLVRCADTGRGVDEARATVGFCACYAIGSADRKPAKDEN